MDNTFNIGTGALNFDDFPIANSGHITSIIILGTGKILIIGSFNFYNGAEINSIARLNSDGTLDTTFNSPINVGEHVYDFEIQYDGKIIIVGEIPRFVRRLGPNGGYDNTFNEDATGEIGPDLKATGLHIQSGGKIIITGYFTSYNGTNRDGYARLNSDGSLDNTFNYGLDGTSRISSQNNGKLILFGSSTSTTINGNSLKGIARLDADGFLDTSFSSGTGISINNEGIYTTAIQNDGKIIIAGKFSLFNGIYKNNIARINTDGSIDFTFDPGTGVDGIVNSTCIQSDGKIIIGGEFRSYFGISRGNLTRLNIDGSIDETFDSSIGFNGRVRAISIQVDGKIIVGGDFSTYNGSLANHIVRLNIDGAIDTTFNTIIGANNSVWTTSIQSDGRVVIGGDFTSYDGTSINRIARLNEDGTLDSNFYLGSGANATVLSTSIQTDGKIIITGYFTIYNGFQKNRIIRLNMDGTLDNTFNTGIGANGFVTTNSIQNDGKIIIGGDFDRYNGIFANKFARLNSDGSFDSSFDPGYYPVVGTNNAYIWTSLIQSDGKIVIGGYFTGTNNASRNYINRFNNDGSLDATFNPGTAANGIVRSISVQGDGQIIIGGEFTIYNGTGRNYIARINGDEEQLGLPTFAKHKIEMYPNPSNGLTNINFGRLLPNIQLEVKDVLGKTVYQHNYLNTQHIELNTSSYSKGLYFINVKHENEIAVLKLIVN